MIFSAILPDDRVTVHKVDAVIIPKLSHRVANVVSFNHEARGLLGVRTKTAGLVEVVYSVLSHFDSSLIDRMILAYREAELNPFANIFLYRVAISI